MDSSSSSGSSKRAKASSKCSQVAHCLVDGCEADLSLCRDYHRRHKVCEIHSKTAKVTIRGQHQRFCQQCSRFHSLGEFDDGKRSCRKRLDGHNRRRRKPQPETLSQNSSFLFPSQSSLSGTTIISFGSPPVLPASVVPSLWPGIVKSENDMELYRYNQHHQVCYNEKPELFLNFSSHSFKEVYHQPHFNGTSVTDPKVFSEGLNHRVVSSDRALSLLSLAPEATEEFSLNHSARHESSSLTDPRFSTVDQDSKPLASSSQYNNDLFHHGEGSSSGRSHKKMPFLWK